MRRLRELEAIAARGSVHSYKVTDINVEISELVARQEDLHVALAQAEHRLSEAEIAQAKIELDLFRRAREGTCGDKSGYRRWLPGDARLLRAVTQVLGNGLPGASGDPRHVYPSLRNTRQLAMASPSFLLQQ